MSHHFANIFSFSGNHEETNADLPIVKVHCNTTTAHDNTTETCNNLATINDNQEYEDYEIRITSVPGPKGDPGGVGGPIDETLVPEHTNVDIGTETIPFRTIYSECVVVLFILFYILNNIQPSHQLIGQLRDDDFSFTPRQAF